MDEHAQKVDQGAGYILKHFSELRVSDGLLDGESISCYDNTHHVMYDVSGDSYLFIFLEPFVKLGVQAVQMVSYRYKCSNYMSLYRDDTFNS